MPHALGPTELLDVHRRMSRQPCTLRGLDFFAQSFCWGEAFMKGKSTAYLLILLCFLMSSNIGTSLSVDSVHWLVGQAKSLNVMLAPV